MHIGIFLGALLAMAGHVVLWAIFWNRLHGCGLAHGFCSKTTAGLVVLGAAIPSAFTWAVLRGDLPLWTFSSAAGPGPSFSTLLAWLANGYIFLCWLVLPYSLAVRIFRRLRGHPAVVCYHRLRAEVSLQPPTDPRGLRRAVVPGPRSASRQSAGAPPDGARVQRYSRVLRLPGNESSRCEFTDVGFQIQRLPPSLEGFSVLHLSDLHFSGRIPNAFYEEVIDAANGYGNDLAVVTGDIVDNSDYLDAACEILGRLQARYGVYFILGNHDYRCDARWIRQRLVESGLIDVGGRVEVLEIGAETLLVGGDERPWGKAVPDFAAAARGDPRRPFRLLLAHTPDQFRWAARHGVDLVLAGHTHGGQVCMPWLGPILTPCASGIRYSAGAFYRPPTAMYVTRGVGGEFPIRYFCPPEVARVVLHAAEIGWPAARERLPDGVNLAPEPVLADGV